MPLYDFVAVDFETANNDLSSACSIGLVAVKNLTVVDTKYSLIRPAEPYFAKKNIEIHGITARTVQDAPQFPAVWEQVQRYFHGDLIVAHNAHFDMSVLKRCLLEYELDIPQFEYLCSIQISNHSCRGKKVGGSLTERANHFGIPTAGHHHALSDAEMCANLVIQSVKSVGENTFRSFCGRRRGLRAKSFAALKPQMSFGRLYHRFESIAYAELAATVESFDRSHPLYGKNLVFTGALDSMSRRAAAQKAVNCGATVKSGVSKKTDIVILGIQDKTLVGPEGTSRKERRAYELIGQGFNIKILREKEFLRLLKR